MRKVENYELKKFKKLSVMKFGDVEIEGQKFLLHKRPASIKIIDINKILASNKFYFGKKGFQIFH